ncbi:DNA-directed RNA polymerase sigma-70 factor [Emticicia aquatilis]|uniref:DNA-directed RNA polymerase sigma-70 factor n=1 Tax=Emticicia aquatilis TaxID=1537369 RepID=A0A916YTF8_9BACT|nr:RNA polymerase sigma-70 factor [Emticicia aquatilis]GGD60012.1 DNA-directed RNA polymerase sigma-70 factor [Emticicia aquatilis]
MKKLPFDTDQELLADIANGDSRAFEILYRRYFSKLYGAAYKRLQDRELTEEVVQELFVSLWERRTTLPIENIESYLFSSIKYLVIAQFKKNSLFEKYSSTLDATENDDNFTEQAVAFDELNQAYQEALQLIPEKCREVFLLKRSGLSQREISERLDISEKTVENQMTKALKILREALKDYTALLILFLLENIL